MKPNKKYFSSDICLIIYIFLSLIFPMHYVAFNSPYYAEFSFANLFCVLYIIIVLLNNSFTKIHKKFVFYLLALLILYNLVSFYVNFTHSRWIWEAFNVSLAFLLLLVLLISKQNSCVLNEKRVISFIMICQTLTMVAGIIVYFIGYSSVSLTNGNMTLIPHDPTYYEKRFNWLYFHKSQYAFIILLFISLIVVYQKNCKNTFFFIVLNLICLFCLVISHTYTALVASFLIYIGYFIDSIKSKLKGVKKTYWLLLIPLLLFVILVIYKMSQERSLFSLGGRTYIWTESIHQILQNPLGVGTSFGSISFNVPGPPFEVFNCHNVFLNEMYRFSLPAGLLFTIMFISVIIYSLKKHFSFLYLGIWGALLISLNMDYSLLGRELTITFFYIYILFFYPYKYQKLRE